MSEAKLTYWTPERRAMAWARTIAQDAAASAYNYVMKVTNDSRAAREVSSTTYGPTLDAVVASSAFQAKVASKRAQAGLMADGLVPCAAGLPANVLDLRAERARRGLR